MADKSGFRIRLRARIAKGLTTEATSLSVVVANKDVTITSENKGEPLDKAKWIVLSARGFTAEEAAKKFGTHLRSILQLAALSSRLGVDAGEDKPTSWVSEEFARSLGLIKGHERVAPNIHGLAILPDDDNTRFPSINVHALVTADPGQFASGGVKRRVAPAGQPIARQFARDRRLRTADRPSDGADRMAQDFQQTNRFFRHLTNANSRAWQHS